MKCPKDDATLVSLGDSQYVCPTCRRFYKSQLIEIATGEKKSILDNTVLGKSKFVGLFRKAVK